ncbi:hypothetical protein GCM10012320_34910 [Sinomonas cellulolyticus]|uniref:Three-Cys-motif partner protein TcmP n=1 Tax=Sinomonas cellulolyticus TaxID=2801916 RepID=A0ABS1K4M5_9MICC|nr:MULTISPECIES: three-Cys-motif partner protein TcmP [Sinomonas]MBL0706619.1 three-Cys-motif partner protein TcmP [Sinomonas cellulolyticus]GHG60353.1 hypothetical protein GCM10012320_34910 [Sinomonas sp. KCTC 49339]
MSSNRQFFREKQPAAVFKHKLLENYLHIWAARLGRWNPQGLAFIDGYAGEGRYGSGYAGSPAIALKVAREGRQKAPLRSIFVEKAGSVAAILEQVIEAEGSGLDVVGPLRGTLEEQLPAVLGAASGRPALFFLDPFGTSLDMRLLVDRVLRRHDRVPTEVLLNFNIESVWRIGGLLAKRTSSHAAAAEAGLKNLDRFLGGSWWQDCFLDARRALEMDDDYATAGRAAQIVADEYARLVCSSSGYSHLKVPVRRNREALPFFSLMLFYTHDAAKLPFLASAARAHQVWRQELWERYSADYNRDALPILFRDLEREAKDETEAIRMQAISEIQDNVRRLLEGKSSLKLSPVIEELFGLVIGTAGEPELRAALRGLEQEGLIRHFSGTVRLDQLTIHRAA